MSERAGRTIDRDEFFYVINDDYDEHAELAIPHYRQLHHEMLSILVHTWRRREPLSFLDLGCGTGKTAGLILSEFRKSRLLGIDLFPEMLRHAEERLEQYAERVRLQKGDFMSCELGGDYDVCVSALAIHHQDAAGKKALFRRIQRSLKPDGQFLMIDWTKFDDVDDNEFALQLAARHVSQAVARADIVKAWIDHWRHKNLPETVADLCSWLRAAGFSGANGMVRYYGMTLIKASK